MLRPSVAGRRDGAEPYRRALGSTLMADRTIVKCMPRRPCTLTRPEQQHPSIWIKVCFWQRALDSGLQLDTLQLPAWVNRRRASSPVTVSNASAIAVQELRAYGLPPCNHRLVTWPH